jgi:hypothetical protein
MWKAISEGDPQLGNVSRIQAYCLLAPIDKRETYKYEYV